MADRTIGSLPAAASIEDDSRLVAEQQGEAVHFTGKQLKDYAKSGLDALVAQAQTAAEAADKAAADAEADAKTAADKAAAVTDDAEAAAQAAKTATEAQAAAQAAREASENAKTAAEQAASAAAQAAADQVKATLENYVTQAEQAKNDAQSAAQTAADDAVAEATQQVAGYVAAAESAKEAAEKARDEAQAIVGSDFMDKAVYDPNGKATDIFKYVDDARALYIDLSDGVSHTNAYDEIKTAYDAGRPIIAVYSGSHDIVDDITMTYEHQHVPLMSINDEYASFIVNDLPHRLVILAFADGSVSARVDLLSHMNSSFLNLGENITKVSANDTVAFWAAKESGQAWFSANNMLVNQPNQYGFVISYVHDTNVFQIFSDQTNGVTYFRYGDNVNNWFKNWSLIPTVNARGELIIDGNIKGVYTIGEWLQTTTTENHQTDAAEKIAVLDGNGLVYYRTPAEILRDVGAMPNISVTASDNGKFLRVVNGAWAAVSISNAEEASF